MGWFMGADSAPAANAVASFAIVVGPYDPLSAVALAAGGQSHWTPAVVEEASQRVVGGPLYPPIQAVMFAPFGLLDPLDAYHVNQVLSMLWALGAGFGVSYLTRGRIWAPIAFTIIVLYPGFRGALHLGQNPPFTLFILIWGWALLSRGKDVAGGLVWGLLAYKPVWAMAFFLVPLLTRRWRFATAMLGMGAALALVTLPVVGVHSWLEWLQVGRIASELYNSRSELDLPEPRPARPAPPLPAQLRGPRRGTAGRPPGASPDRLGADDRRAGDDLAGRWCCGPARPAPPLAPPRPSCCWPPG